MLIAFKKMTGSSVIGNDGKVGSIADVFFNGTQWNVRYLVVDTSKWLPGRKVILSPSVFETLNWTERLTAVPLTKEQVENSPNIDSDKPVSWQMEIELAKHYKWAPYWGLGATATPAVTLTAAETKSTETDPGETETPHLRSAVEVKNYQIEAMDGRIGHVEDFLVDDQGWVIRYLVVNTRNWLPGKSVIISPQWADSIHWEDKTIQVGLTRTAIEEAPEFDPSAPVNRRYEEHLYDVYGRERYWSPVA